MTWRVGTTTGPHRWGSRKIGKQMTCGMRNFEERTEDEAVLNAPDVENVPTAPPPVFVLLQLKELMWAKCGRQVTTWTGSRLAMLRLHTLILKDAAARAGTTEKKKIGWRPASCYSRARPALTCQ